MLLGALVDAGADRDTITAKLNSFAMGATITWRALSKRAHLIDHRQVHGFAGARTVTVRSGDERPLPLQVDGDYIGEVSEARFRAVPEGLLIVS